MSFEKQWKQPSLEMERSSKIKPKKVEWLVGLNVNQYMVVTKF
jgi:hypothetical protein